MPVPDFGDLVAPAVSSSVPVQVGGPREDDRIKIAPNYPFTFVHHGQHPGNWFAAEIKASPGVPDEELGVWWLPKLQALPAKAGVCGHRTIRADERPEDSFKVAYELVEREGGVVLPISLGYMQAIPCVHPFTQAAGMFYCDVWTRPRPRYGNEPQKFDHDAQRYYRWLLRILAMGLIEEPLPWVLKRKRVQLGARVARRSTLWHLPDAAREDYAEEARKLLLAAEQAATVEPPASAPMPELRRRAPHMIDKDL